MVRGVPQGERRVSVLPGGSGGPSKQSKNGDSANHFMGVSQTRELPFWGGSRNKDYSVSGVYIEVPLFRDNTI